MTGHRWLTALALCAALVGTRTQAQTTNETPRDAGGYRAPTAALERGRAVFVLNHCHFCHGEDLTRANMGAANLTQSPLVGADVDGNTIGAIVKAGLPNLQTAMPSYRDLTAVEIVELARYVHYLRQQAKFNELMGSGEMPSGDARRGQAFYEGTGGCAACHVGGNALTGVTRKYEATALRARLLRPGPAKPVEGVDATPGQASHLRLLENYTRENVADLLAFLKSRD